MDIDKTTREIRCREHIGCTASVLQTQTLLTRSIALESASLILVREGSKRVCWQHRDILLQPGDAILIAADCTLDVTNIRSSETGIYAAEWLSFPDALTTDEPHALYSLCGGFRQAFYHARAAIMDPEAIPERVAVKRMEEVQIWLEESGLRWAPVKAEKLSRQVRKRVSDDLARQWLAPDIAQHFAMSESTFRRRLAAEGMSFHQLLTEARMCHALTLLQVTDMAVNQVALAVGYESPSKFTARFRTRFGFNPAQIRERLAIIASDFV
ncbi:helix-turn-helix domain-containing protein [Serratia sp. CY54039]|uniref:helix-turn-helix transcriptional regulator n=1 Tax=Serratia TaxID=613 RepID=UPI000B5EC9C9|nr:MULTISPECIES: helix-turn-helix domain-containing protein [Serratia]ASM02510.1 hypothetical protein BVG88_10215 [Serratia marcescens]EMD1303500.1 helix-turn-helix domain-containing protein [Serratia marcescens]EMD1306902.1 helix-turn-helix domain-containing protein [Serratia marcescens]MBH2987717.1 helix-turn-helix domain-containing protein [Serratia ureilytica]MBH3140886.1 helix-turn-helix domain-containing protein [Serratia ureilytica]